MDDDLRTLLGDTDDDEDLFGAFDEQTPEQSSPPLGQPTDEDYGVPDWVASGPPDEAGDQGQAQPARRKRRKRSTGFLGMTAFQRMILSIFLFLDVVVIGFMFLLALGRITF